MTRLQPGNWADLAGAMKVKLLSEAVAFGAWARLVVQPPARSPTAVTQVKRRSRGSEQRKRQHLIQETSLVFHVEQLTSLSD